jgi:hypothetical protein
VAPRRRSISKRVFTIIKDSDLETADEGTHLAKELKALDAFDNRKLFHNKDEGFQPSTYSYKLRGKIETAKND